MIAGHKRFVGADQIAAIDRYASSQDLEVDMRKIVLGTLAALLLGTAAMATPAEARCFWNGYAMECWHPHHWGYWHHPHWDYGYWR